ncbi:MAG TPA: hypothetical protein VF789_19275 [Thermoanaerobaculia bacterium]
MMIPLEPELAPLYRAKQALSDQLLRANRADGLVLRSRSVEKAVAAAASGQNVHAVGIGRKIVEGIPTDTMCVQIYVTQKLAPSLIGDNALPSEVEGVPTDVIESAPAFLLPAVTAAEEIAVPGVDGIFALATAPQPCSADRRRRQRPVRAGISTGHIAITAGTISCFCRSVRPGDNPEQVYVLSNNHVYADVNNASPGDLLLQQGRADGGGAADEIARLDRFVFMNLGGVIPNRVDGAIGRLSPGVSFDPEICSIGRINGTAQAFQGMRVRKHGRTTGLTEGAVTSINYDALVGMDHMDPSVVARFVDQIRVERTAPHPTFGLGGDSGSLVVTSEGTDAVGLYFAGPDSGFYGIANPIGAVLAELQIELI